MLFNSLDFAIFLPVTFVLYWFIFQKKIRLQNLLIVCASYLFYGWWDWRFLTLIIFSTLVDYTIGSLLKEEQVALKRKIYLWISITINLGFLGFFKYYNFFIESFTEAFLFLGKEIKPNTLNIILPVGISFYTFQTLSYTIDVYKKKLEPTTDFIAFAAFVSFFPQLVAGPIERATNLLPQFYTKRKFDYSLAILGLRQILWGLFKKVIIADNCAKYANIIFNNYEIYDTSTLILGALFFTFQIYGDFSGYSDIAIGTSRLFGFNLMQNFAFPYFSRDIAEFWRRWHISLSTWFRDYLYIPLGGSKGGMKMKIRNTFIIFLVSGFWHGANWTFVFWGFLNALYFLPLLLRSKNRVNTNIVAEGKWLPNLKETIQMLFTFSLTVFAWIFFRADSITHAYNYISSIFINYINAISLSIPNEIFYLITLFLVIEWLGRSSKFAIEKLQFIPKILRWMFYLALILLLFMFAGEEQEFIYFQF
ncbi:D-alanyl-lipoteichoic acid acyltransferase DltB (MBOAT superfamily) [Maribacter caenipelagi]|uniref:D-alanyl-lipoteichoic acid acyltransferase DltB (MBOAT superfamily) n=1 Tax=Maribacter caenipelagi TaxID=1447781 RepID=A0A4R7D3L3_9FLAO|nr:MBOAT family O-acyltransferase [Maribacter caenipelagi]TDS13446.1 D-alanyl-lipoteichoic acid acyltransferase DltB (MBOAT superfamily) [Maribacter caenipelagi]